MTEGGSSIPSRKGVSLLILFLLISSLLVIVQMPEGTEASPPLARSYEIGRAHV